MKSTALKQPSKLRLDYHHLVSFMKELRAYFNKELNKEYTVGKVNSGSKDYTYFSLTPEELKSLKLKFVIILDHKIKSFVICLSGQNKSIRKKYWHELNERGCDKYHLAESIDQSLMIIDHIIVNHPDFTNAKALSKNIERESLIFMNELKVIIA